MQTFLSALQFLTIIPFKTQRSATAKLADAPVYFPVIGFCIGMILAGLNQILSFAGFPAWTNASVIVVASIILTGGLHCDGLADTFDALASGKTREEMLAIMRDPHIGVMGTLAILCDVLLKIAFLSALDTPARTVALILACSFSRWSLVAAMYRYPYVRDNGKAKAFTEGLGTKRFVLATALMAAIFCGISSKPALSAILAGGLAGFVFIRHIRRRLGGITGDTLGALNEISEIAVLAAICLTTSV